MKRIYGFLLNLYPIEFQLQFRDEMTAIFDRSAAERHGQLGYMLFVARELLSLLAGAFKERHSSQTAPPEGLSMPTNITDISRQVQLTSRLVIHAIANHDFARARRYDLHERKLRARLSELRPSLQ